MNNFIVIFLPKIAECRKIGEGISLLECINLRLIEAYRFQMDPEKFEKTNEYLRLAHHHKEIFHPDEANRRNEELKEQIKNGKLTAFKFNSEIVETLNNLLFMMKSQTRISPYDMMIFKEEQL